MLIHLTSAIVVGCPPAYRGGTTKGRDLEIQMLKLFPKTAYFIEKVSFMTLPLFKLAELWSARGHRYRRSCQGSHSKAHREWQYRLRRIYAQVPPMRSEDETDHP